MWGVYVNSRELLYGEYAFHVQTTKFKAILDYLAQEILFEKPNIINFPLQICKQVEPYSPVPPFTLVLYSAVINPWPGITTYDLWSYSGDH